MESSLKMQEPAEPKVMQWMRATKVCTFVRYTDSIKRSVGDGADDIMWVSKIQERVTTLKRGSCACRKTHHHPLNHLTQS